MAAKWNQISQSDEFKALSSNEKQAVRGDFFERVVRPEVPEGQLEAVRSDFLNATEADVFGGETEGTPATETGGTVELVPGSYPGSTRGQRQAEQQRQGVEEQPQAQGLDFGPAVAAGDVAAAEDRLQNVRENTREATPIIRERALDHLEEDVATRRQRLSDQALGDPDPQPEDGNLAADLGKEVTEGAVSGTGATVGGVGDLMEVGGAYVERGLRGLGLGDIIDKGDEALGNMAPSDAFQRFQGWMNEGAEQIDDTQSEEFRQAMRDSMPAGDITNPASWNMGEDPSVMGYAGQMAGLIGQFAPQAATMIAGTPQKAMAAMSLVGGAQAGGSQAEEAEQRVLSMDEQQLGEASGLYSDLRERGMAHEEAQQQTAKAAGAAAFMGGAPVGAAGGALTSYVLGPFQRAVGGGIAGRAVKGIGLEGSGEAAQEVTETVTARAATNEAIEGDQDVTEGTFGDAVLGGMFGAGIGGAGAAAGGLDATPRRTPNDAVRERTAEDRAALNEQFELDQQRKAQRDRAQRRAEKPRMRVGIDGQPLGLDLEQGAVASAEAVGQPAAPEAEAAQEQPAKSASVPTMMTRRMRKQLGDLGYDADEIKRMKPQDAWDRIEKGQRSTRAQVEEAGAEVNTEPTEAQAEAGNYRKGHLRFKGMDVSIENPRGSKRRGRDPDGNEWESTLAHDYGDIKGSEGADGDNLDIFIGPDPDNDKVYVIDQLDQDGEFDEHKIMTGFPNKKAARKGYMDNYPRGWKGLGQITRTDPETLKTWTREGDTKRPFGEIPEPEPAPVPKGIAAQRARDAKAEQDRPLFRGSGRQERGEVYAGAEVPVLGEGTYFATSEQDAQQYGPQVETANQSEVVSNPLVIRSDNDWRKLAKDAGWDVPNPTGKRGSELEALTRQLRDEVIRRGHDGVVVDWDNTTPYDVDENGRKIKLLRDVFDVPQVVSYNRPASEQTRYRQADRQGPYPSDVKVAIQTLRDQGLPAEVVDTVDQLPSQLRDRIDRDGVRDQVTGVRSQGTSWLVASNMDSVEEATRTVLHEAVGHDGVRKVLGQDIDSTLDAVYRDMPSRDRQRLEGLYAGQLANKSAEEGRRIVAEEHLAHLAETQPQSTLVSRAVSAVRKFLRRLFGDKAAKQWGRQEIVDLLARAREAADVRSPAQKRAADEPRYALRFNRTFGGFPARIAPDGTMTVKGDPAEIRAQLPGNLKGRQVQEGLRFTPNLAPQARNALEGRTNAYSRGGQVAKKLPMKNGKYVGAPKRFNTPGKIGTLRRNLRQLAEEGEPGRFWYENSGDAVMRMVGGDLRKARQFTALLSIYSPQAKVDTNGTFALRAWAQYEAGQPINVKTKVQDQKAQEALDDIDAFWSGEKTGNFFHNLLRQIDPSTEGSQGATIDMWMMRAARYDHDAPNASEYAFMENETNRVAQAFDWEPQQVQAAIWVAMKARMENAEVKRRTEQISERKGWIHFKEVERNGRTRRERVIDDPQKHLQNWIDQAMKSDVDPSETVKAKFDFADAIARHIGQVSWEARPGRSTGVLPGVHEAPYEQQVEFQQAVHNALRGDQGEDLVAVRLGLIAEPDDLMAPGAWQGEVSAGMQKQVAVAPAAGGAQKAEIDQAARDALDLYANLLGLMTYQEGIGWHRPFPSTSKVKANALDINIGRPLTDQEMGDLSRALDEHFVAKGQPDWQNALPLVSTPQGVRLLNMGTLPDGRAFEALYGLLDPVLPDGYETGLLRFNGGFADNDWQENPNGQGYTSRIAAAGRPDLLDWARDQLQPRIQRVLEDFSERYGWGDPGDIRYSLRPERAGDRGGREAGRGPAPLAGAPQGSSREGKGPDEGLVAVAERYAEQQGITLRRQGEYAQVDPERGARIAEAYEAMEHDPQDPRVQAAYQDMIRQTRAQYDALVEAGYEFTFFDGDTDPYDGNPWNAMRDLRNNKRMAVYGTYDGYGTEGITGAAIEENPLLEDTGLEWPDQNGVMRPVTANDLFRAVHDAFGHGLEGAGFRARGEENAWQAHIRLFTGDAVGAVTTETRGQNSWLNFGPYAETNQTAGIEDTIFAEQKVGLMPEWTWLSGRVGDKPLESRDEAFQTWFGDSKVVDAEGDPLVVYHGTNESFTQFDGDRAGNRDPGFFGSGFYFTADLDDAEAYAEASVEDSGEGDETLMESYVSLQDPFIWDMRDSGAQSTIDALAEMGIKRDSVRGDSSSLGNPDERRAFNQGVRERGHDGVIVYDGDGVREVVAFYPEQIKSVDNRGTFDPGDPDIRYALREPVRGGRSGSNRPSYRDAELVYAQVRENFLEVVPEDATGEDVMDSLDEFSGVEQRLLRALERDDWLGFDHPSQALDAVMTEDIDAFEVSPAVKRALGRLVNEYDMRYALREPEQSRVSKQFDDLTEQQAEALDMIGPLGVSGSAMEKLREVMTRAAVKLRAGLVDKYAALKELDEKALGRDFIETSTASSSWILARMAPAAQGALHTMLHANRIRLDPQQKVIEPVSDATDQGLVGVLDELGSSEEVTRFMGWIAGNRADRLAREGRENYFDPEHIQGLMELNNGRTKDGTPRRGLYARVFERFQQFRDDVLAIAEESGLLRPALNGYEALQTMARQYGVSEDLRKQLRTARRKVSQAEDIMQQEMAEDRFDGVAQAVIDAAAPDAQTMEEVQQLLDDLQTSQREMWANEFYVPFYRVLDENTNDVRGPASTAGLTRQRAYRRLKGADMRVGDLLENTLMNFNHLLTASLKNQAARQAIDNAMSLEIAREVPASNRDPESSTFILRDGQQVYYEIDDPLVYKALVNMTDSGMQALMNSTAMKAMRGFKRLLTNMVTVTAEFVGANTIRDSLQSAAVTPAGMNPMWNAVRGAAYYGSKKNRAKMLASGGSFQFGHLYGDRSDELKAQIGRNLRDVNVIKDPFSVFKPIKWSWRRWNDATEFAENINRAKVYQANLDRGKLYAAFQSRDLMDFSSHGSWFMTRFLIDTVPFLNARLQGLDKIYRDGMKPALATAFGKGSESDHIKARRFSVVTGALAAASIGLYLHNAGDEDYEELEEWQKDTYWFFKFGDNGFFIPKPFEVGAIATMAERVTEQFVDDDATGELFRERLGHMLGQTFAFRPVPQMLAPVQDIYANYDPFRDRPIESFWQQEMSPSLRFRPSTTMPARAASAGLEATFGDESPMALSPIQLDYLVSGYLGTVGSYATGIADTLWRSAIGQEAPSSRWYESKPVRRFFRDLATPAYYSRYQTLFYEGLEEANRVYADKKRLEELRRLEEARELVDSKREWLRLRSPLARAQRQLSDINKRMDRVQRSTEKDGDRKRRELEHLRTIKNQITETLGKQVEDVRAGD